jgi:nucleolar protein 9
MQAEDTEFTHWVLKVGRFVLNNLEEFVWDAYANHVIRTVTNCLGGITPGTAGNYKKHVKPGMKIFEGPIGPLVKSSEVSPEYTELLKEFVHRLSAWPQFQGWYPVKVKLHRLLSP